MHDPDPQPARQDALAQCAPARQHRVRVVRHSRATPATHPAIRQRATRERARWSTRRRVLARTCVPGLGQRFTVPRRTVHRVVRHAGLLPRSTRRKNRSSSRCTSGAARPRAAARRSLEPAAQSPDLFRRRVVALPEPLGDRPVRHRPPDPREQADRLLIQLRGHGRCELLERGRLMRLGRADTTARRDGALGAYAAHHGGRPAAAGDRTSPDAASS